MSRDNPTNVSSGQLFLVTLLTYLGCYLLVFGLIAAGVIGIGDFSGPDSTVADRQGLRVSLLLANLLPFAGSAVLALALLFRRRWPAAAGLTHRPRLAAGLYATVFFIASLPFVGWLTYWNLQLDLPEWMARSEANTDQLLKGVLTMTTPLELIVALLAAALTPALGEELLMRGVLQRRILRPAVGNVHVAIWVAATVFSTMHQEFGGFAPRLLLGGLLGYTYYWSRSLWVPIGLHFAFNGVQVVIAYLTGEFNPEADAANVPPNWLAALSLTVVVVLGYRAQRLFGAPETEAPKG